MNPDQVRYSTSASEGVPAEAEQVIFRSELNSYDPDSNKFVRINLPVQDKAFVDFGDTTLSLKLTNRSADTASASTAHSTVKTQLCNLIKSVSILNSQGEQIEYINNYNLLANIVDDYTMGTNHKAGVAQILSGGSATGDPDGATGLAGSATTGHTDGESIVLVDGLMTAFTSGQYLLPLGFLVGGSGCSIVLELEDPNVALTLGVSNPTPAPAGVVVKYKVEDVQLRAKVIRFNSGFNDAFMGSMAEAGEAGINYISQTYLHNQGTLATGTSGIANVNFSPNPRSAIYILACMRKEADITNKEKLSLGCRASATINQYTFEINGKSMPSQPIEVSNSNISQAYANVLDCFGQINNMSHNTLITRAGARTLFYSATEATDSKFIAGITLEDFNSSVNNVYSGMNLSNVGTLSFRPKLTSGLSANYRIDFLTSCNVSFHFTLEGRCYSVK
tara:strand:+ start:88 stop:1434 length:1347 start_codon:yes stop_codon:yes gene_type:complete